MKWLIYGLSSMGWAVLAGGLFSFVLWLLYASSVLLLKPVANHEVYSLWALQMAIFLVLMDGFYLHTARNSDFMAAKAGKLTLLALFPHGRLARKLYLRGELPLAD